MIDRKDLVAREGKFASVRFGDLQSDDPDTDN